MSALEIWRVAAVGLLVACGAPPVVVDPATPLSASLESLEVTRVGRDGERVGARFDPAVVSAKSLHERSVAAPEGEVHGRWVLGEPAWDGVGRTRQRSGGEPADGLWAHPRDGTELFVESAVAIDGSVLEGFFGFSDFSIEHAASLGVAAPVRFHLSIDDLPVVAADVPRQPGWIRFRAEVPEPGPRTRRLRVRIASDDDTWAHFVFDVRAAAD